MTDFLFKDGDKVVFTGDSITDAGRKRPIGEGLWEGVGTGFVRQIDNFINVFYPERLIHIVNTGISGNTSRELSARIDEDVINLKPDYCVICIGVNDVWRYFDEPSHKDEHVSIEEYSENLLSMIERLNKNGIKPIFITPYYIENNNGDKMRAMMDEFRAKMTETAAKFNIPVIDVQKAFDKLLKYRYPAYITWDRVHPNNTGSLVIATEFLKSLNFDFDRLK